jgi:hypothetical protein
MRWYADLMTDAEKAAQRHLSATLKATMGRSDVAAQQEAQFSNTHARLLSSDPEVLRLTCDGWDAFIERTAARILHDNGVRLRFNRCPRCNGLARTPMSKQCRFCGNDWHSS